MRTEEFYLLKGIYLADGVAIAEAVVVVPPGSQPHHEVSTSKITKLTSGNSGALRKLVNLGFETETKVKSPKFSQKQNFSRKPAKL
jgi:hypothetical protein